MKEKKKSDLAVLLGYAGSYKGLTFLGLGRPRRILCNRRSMTV